jgi:nitric oxide synthase oxygenase domain/subunit
MEEALKKEKENAQEASKAKETFLANMSHEIRTPQRNHRIFKGIGKTGSYLRTKTVCRQQQQCISASAFHH